MKLRLAGICLFLIGWYALAWALTPLLLPPPHSVLKSFFLSFAEGALYADVMMTLVRLLIGFGVGATLGVSMGLVVGSVRQLYESTEFIVDFFRSVPGTALFPLFLLIFGLGDASKCAMAAYSATLVTMFNTAYGVRHSSRTRILVATTMGATRWQMFTKVTLPQALPQIVVGLRLSVSSALIYIVVTEMFMGTTTGLGYRIFNANLLFRVREMYAMILAAGILGYVLNQFFALGEKRFVHWVGK